MSAPHTITTTPQQIPLAAPTPFISFAACTDTILPLAGSSSHPIYLEHELLNPLSAPHTHSKHSVHIVMYITLIVFRTEVYEQVI